MARLLMKRGNVSVCLLLFLTAYLVVFSAFADEPTEAVIEPGFTVYSAETRVVADTVLLDASFGLQFSQKLFDALHNGITLNLTIDIRVLRERAYIWDTKIVVLKQHYTISYSPLTEYYTLTNVNEDIQFRFPRFGSLLAVVSELFDFPLMDRALLKEDTDYRGAIRISVDRGSLPVPLRLMSYVRSGWHFVSEWYSWSLPQ